jgi:hypothetical protein
LIARENVIKVFIEEELAHDQPGQCGEGLDRRAARGERKEKGLFRCFSGSLRCLIVV